MNTIITQLPISKFSYKIALLILCIAPALNGCQTDEEQLLSLIPEQEFTDSGTFFKHHGHDLFDTGEAIEPTNDGGYIIAGSSEIPNAEVGSFGEAWIFKTNAVGEMEWETKLGGKWGDNASGIVQTQDGGYLAAGMRSFYEDDRRRQVTLLKLDANGELEWEKDYGGEWDDKTTSMQETTDGGFILTGVTATRDGIDDATDKYEAWVIKLNSQGDIEWQKILGGSLMDEANQVIQAADGGYVVAGMSKSADGDVGKNNGDSDAWVFKLDANGELIWSQAFGGTDSDYATSITQSPDGGYVVVGGSESLEGDGDVSNNIGFTDFWVLKLDANGNLQWNQSYGGRGNDIAAATLVGADGGYVVAGHSRSSDGQVESNAGQYDIWVIKIDDDGALIWKKSIGLSGHDMVEDMKYSRDGNYILTGNSKSSNEEANRSDAFLLKLDYSGNFVQD